MRSFFSILLMRHLFYCRKIPYSERPSWSVPDFFASLSACVNFPGASTGSATKYFCQKRAHFVIVLYNTMDLPPSDDGLLDELIQKLILFSPGIPVLIP